ncbi:hypothetical protein [Shewanella sp.]|uniref:hypothetical protein n=1 Tax=Shewanella sp. TaxID=50422 RepID=UPI003A97164E
MQAQRISDPVSIDADAISTLINANITPIIQFSEAPNSNELLAEVNQLCQRFEAQIEVRFYGFYQQPQGFDGRRLQHLPDVANLSLDCLQQATQLEQLLQLPQLTKLRLGIYHFDQHELLHRLDLSQLTSLSLVENRQRNIDLSFISDCPNLNTLFIQGHSKNIEVISQLTQLNSLALSGIGNKQSLAFINHLDQLQSLWLMLGSRDSLAEITLPALQQLELCRIKQLTDLGDLSRFSQLQQLKIEDQAKLGQLSFSQPNDTLTALKLWNVKQLQAINGLSQLSALTAVDIHISQLALDTLLAELPAPVEKFDFSTSSAKQNRLLQARLRELGYRSNRPQHQESSCNS